MKNFFRLIGIIAIVAVIWFSFAACDDGGSGGGGGGNGGGSGNGTGGGDNTWTLVADSKLSWGYAIAYGNGKFVAVGGKMATSTDGKTWTEVPNSTFGTDDINAIAFGNGKFVAGGNKGKVAYSSDGITWTAVTTTAFNYIGGSKGDIHAIAYGGGKFVVGFDNRIAYSSDDGVTWTTLPNETVAYQVYAIAYGNGKFVAGGTLGKTAYSTDGITWTDVENTIGYASNHYIEAIAYGGSAGQEKFVAVGYGGSDITYSSNGVTWTAVPNSTFGGTSTGASTINAIAYGNGKFVAGSYDGKTAYSSDGITWTAIPRTVNSAFFKYTQGSTHFYYEINAIAYGNGTFVAGCEGGKIAYSTGL